MPCKHIFLSLHCFVFLYQINLTFSYFFGPWIAILNGPYLLYLPLPRHPSFTKHYLHVSTIPSKNYISYNTCYISDPSTHLHLASFLHIKSMAMEIALQILAALLVSYLPHISSSANFSYVAVFNFGDSNSDTGGLVAGVAFPVGPPNGQTYFLKPSGRFCDGRLVIDFLSMYASLFMHMGMHYMKLLVAYLYLICLHVVYSGCK